MSTPERIVLRGRKNLLMPLIMQILATHQMIKDRDIGNFYGTIGDEINVERDYSPEVEIIFKQTHADYLETKDEFKYGTSGSIRFFLRKYSSTSIGVGEIKLVGERIKEVFGEGEGFVWHKGKTRVKYIDIKHGFHLDLLCNNEEEGVRVIEAALSTVEQSIDLKNILIEKSFVPAEKYPDFPTEKVVLGLEVKTPRQRPYSKVVFAYAVMHVRGLRMPVQLARLNHAYPAHTIAL